MKFFMWLRRRRVTYLLREIAGNRAESDEIYKVCGCTNSISEYQTIELARLARQIAADEAELRELLQRWPDLNTLQGIVT